MSAPVRKITFSDSRLKGEVGIDLKWDLVHPEGQKEFDRLDADDSGDLSFSKEIRFSDATAERFFRTFWAFGGDAPHNRFKTDEATRAARRAEAERIQGEVFEKIVRPLVKGQKDLSVWQEAGRLLGAMADPAHLCDLSALAKAEGGTDFAFLQISEYLLLEAKRLAAGTRWGRSELFAKIDKALQKVGGELEKAEAERFKKDITHPHFLLGPGAPVTADYRSLLQGGSLILRVTVPKGFDKDKLVETLNGLNPCLAPSVFEGARSGSESYALEAKALVNDASSVIRKGRLSSLYYGQARDYYEVSFTVKENGETLQGLMAKRDVRRFDFVYDLPEAKGRAVAGGVVVHDKQGRDIRMAFASDLHINERDYEIRKILIDSLRTVPMGGREAPDTAAMERVERFYESFNEHLEAAVAQWNREYREGKLDYVVLAGDLADFINIPTTSAPQLYRGTNFRRLAHILSKLEVPYYAKPGNHDVHLRPFPVSVHAQHFAGDPWLYQFLEGHYDDYRFKGPEPMLVQGVMALIPRSWPEPKKGEDGGLDFYVLALGELLSSNPYGKVNDEGLPPYWRSTEVHEADVTPLGNKLFLYHWKTNEEDFNQQRWAFEQVNEPVGLNLLRSFRTYVFSQHVNGKGPRPEVFRHFLNTVASVKAQGGTMVVAQHYPAFYLGVGPDQTADSEDALRGPVNWAFRLATWYYRHDNGSPVVDLVVAGHVHRYGEYDFQLDFGSADEEKNFRKDLGTLLTQVAGGSIKDGDVYDRFDDLRKKYVLDQHLVTDRYLDPKNGFPGPVGQAYNQSWQSACAKRGSLFVNLPALGPTTADSPSGFIRVTVKPNGQKTVATEYFFLEPDGRVLGDSGDRLPALKKIHRGMIGDWFTSHGDDPVIPKDTDSFNPPEPLSRDEQRARAFAGPPLLDPLPLLCQYPKGKICLGAGIGATYQITNQGAGAAFSATPLSLTFPLSDRHHPVFGVNYFRAGLNYNSGFHQWSGDLSLGLGIFEPHVFSGFRFDQPGNILGGGIKFGSASSMVIPAIDLFGFSSMDRSLYGGGIGATWQWELLSVQPKRYRHSH